jgi:hypothetical protein
VALVPAIARPLAVQKHLRLNVIKRLLTGQGMIKIKEVLLAFRRSVATVQQRAKGKSYSPGIHVVKYIEAIVAYLSQVDKVNFVLNIVCCRCYTFNVEVSPFLGRELLLSDGCRYLSPL